MLTIAQRAFLFESDPSRPDYACLGAGFRGYLGASLWPTGRLQEQFRHNPVHHAATNYLQIAGYIAESIVGSDGTQLTRPSSTCRLADYLERSAKGPAGPRGIQPQPHTAEDRGAAFSGSKRDSSRSPVPSTSQDLVLQGAGPLILPTSQTFSTHRPDF